MSNEIKIDVFDQGAIEKFFDEIESKADKMVSFDKSAIAKKMGIKEEDLSLPGDKYTPGIKIIKNIQNTDFRSKVTNAMAELRAEQITGGNGGYSSLTPEQKTQVDVELGKVDKDDFVNNEKTNWMYKVTHTKTRGSGDKVNNNVQVLNYQIPGNKDNKDLTPLGALKDTAEDRDKSHMISKVGKNTVMYVNEESKNDPNTANWFFNGKQSGIRMGKEGFHITTDQAMNMSIGSCENIKVNGQSAKHVDGGYNLIVDGPINIYAKDSISISTDGDMNITAKGNINLQCKGNFGLRADGNVSILSKSETALNAVGKLSLATEAELHLKTNGGCFFGGQGSISLKGAGEVNIDGATVNINGGKSGDASPTKLPDFNVPAAAPTDPVVPNL